MGDNKFMHQIQESQMDGRAKQQITKHEIDQCIYSRIHRFIYVCLFFFYFHRHQSSSLSCSHFIIAFISYRECFVVSSIIFFVCCYSD